MARSPAPVGVIPVAPGARQRRKEARPQELLAAALELFVEKGFSLTRAEEVAKRAGVSKGTLYLYYPSKEELLKAVIAHYLSASIEATAAQVAQYRGSMATLMRESLVGWWQQVYASPASGTFKLLITEVRNFPSIAEFYAREVVERGHFLIGGILQRGVAAGEFRPVDIDSSVHSIVLPMVMVCLHKHSMGACSPHVIDGQRFIAEHVELVLHSLLATTPLPRPARARKRA